MQTSPQIIKFVGWFYRPVSSGIVRYRPVVILLMYNELLVLSQSF
jgi:hypothetical protein